MRHSYSSSVRGRRPGLRISWILAATLALAACGSADSEGKPQGQQQQQPPVPVDVETVIPHTVNVTAKYPGRVQGARTVQVLARVEGVLLERHYDEGQIVQKGDLLANIDPKPFQAKVNQRKAELASAKASLNQAQRTWRRVHKLYDLDAVSEAERDDALSRLETARASVQQANANLDSTQIDLSYTRVHAPLTGVTSLRETDEGSLVSNGTKLTTITQLDPVHVLFALPEDDAVARRKALAAMGAKSTDGRSREATIILPNGDEFPTQGVVDFTQSTINPETGTVQLRAVVGNTDNALMPGRYVRTRITLETRHNAVVVPEIAVSDGNDGTQVLVVDGNDKAKAVDVKLGPTVEGGRLVKSGLAGGERVIISGLGQVKPKAKVKIKSNKDDPSVAPKKPNGGSDKQPTTGESAAAGGRTPADNSVVADIDNSALRLSPHEPLQQMPTLPKAQASYRLDNTVAANVGQGG
jgi:membrane fusion protein (multidrug efflux system)